MARVTGEVSGVGCRVSVETLDPRSLLLGPLLSFLWGRTAGMNPAARAIQERWINVAKRSSVSTGKLNTLLCLHIRPINLVVFQGTFGQLPYET